MRKVWAVSSGSYSDYQVQCLFETRDLARQYVVAQRRSSWEADEARYRADAERYAGLPVNIRGGHQAWIEPPLDADDEAWEKWEGDSWYEPFVETFDLYDALPVVEP